MQFGRPRGKGEPGVFVWLHFPGWEGKEEEMTQRWTGVHSQRVFQVIWSSPSLLQEWVQDHCHHSGPHIVGMLQRCRGLCDLEPLQGVKCQAVSEEDEMGVGYISQRRRLYWELVVHSFTHLVIRWTVTTLLLRAGHHWRCWGCSSERAVLRGEGGGELVIIHGHQHVNTIVTRHPSTTPLSPDPIP